jgi:hypothetical protein
LAGNFATAPRAEQGAKLPVSRLKPEGHAARAEETSTPKKSDRRRAFAHALISVVERQGLAIHVALGLSFGVLPPMLDGLRGTADVASSLWQAGASFLLIFVLLSFALVHQLTLDREPRGRERKLEAQLRVALATFDASSRSLGRMVVLGAHAPGVSPRLSRAFEYATLSGAGAVLFASLASSFGVMTPWFDAAVLGSIRLLGGLVQFVGALSSLALARRAMR